MYRSLAAVLLGCIITAGCQSTGGPDSRASLIGSGPVTLSLDVQKKLQRYMTAKVPMGFAVTEDGSDANGVTCLLKTNLACRGLVAIDIVHHCERETGKRCLIYALGRDIVWGTNSQRRISVPTTEDMESDHARYRYLDVIWGGEEGVGNIRIDPEREAMRLELVTRSRGACLGELNRADAGGSGSWGVICRDGLIATGKIEAGKDVEPLSAVGSDREGRNVSFVVAEDG